MPKNNPEAESDRKHKAQDFGDGQILNTMADDEDVPYDKASGTSKL